MLSFIAGTSNQLDSFTRLLHFYSRFRRYPYWPFLLPYGHMAKWPYGHFLTIWPFCHIVKKWSYGINMGIVGNSYKNAATWSRNRVDSTFLQEMRVIMVRWQIFLCIFSENPMYMPKMVATAQKCSKTHEIFFGGS